MTPTTKPVRRITQSEFNTGPDRRRLVITLGPGDNISVRPLRLRSGTFTATISDVYW